MIANFTSEKSTKLHVNIYFSSLKVYIEADFDRI